MDFLFTDVDCICYGNDCVVSAPKPQAHSYEDRQLKLGVVKVGDGCGLVACTLMAGSVVGEGSTVLAKSTVFKSEELPAGRVYSGTPTIGNKAATKEQSRLAENHPAVDHSQDRSCIAVMAAQECGTSRP